MAGGKEVLLLYDAARSLGASWSYNIFENWLALTVETSDAFLAEFATGARFGVQSGNTATSVLGLSGWTLLAHNDIRYTTALSTTDPSGARAAAYTYNPQFYTQEGEHVFRRLMHWLTWYIWRRRA